jgi:hypothetical protein
VHVSVAFQIKTSFSVFYDHSCLERCACGQVVATGRTLLFS